MSKLVVWQALDQAPASLDDPYAPLVALADIWAAEGQRLTQDNEEEYGMAYLQASQELRDTIEELEEKLGIAEVKRRAWRADHNPDALCAHPDCGHPYHRHFDGYDDNAAVGCKYCGCYTFVEVAPVLTSTQQVRCARQHCNHTLHGHQDGKHPCKFCPCERFVAGGRWAA